jgi:hypothetical protein
MIEGHQLSCRAKHIIYHLPFQLTRPPRGMRAFYPHLMISIEIPRLEEIMRSRSDVPVVIVARP